MGLLKSKEFEAVLGSPGLIEDTLSKVLKGTRIGKVFVLRDAHAKILYQSFNVGLLEAELPIQPEWVTVETETEFVRVRNTVIPGEKSLILQVGLVLDRNFINWQIVDARVINYVTGIVVTLFLASVVLTLILLSPLRLLIQHLTVATSNLMNLRDVEPLPTRLTRYTHGYWSRSDEFASLLSTTQKLIDRINLNYKLTRSWTLQMAHELKTPLAIVRAETESKLKAGVIPSPYAEDVNKEIHQMSEIIGQFLEWAELENSQVQRDLHALRMKAVSKAVVARLDKISPGRIRLQVQNDISVFANPSHLDQLITNLLSNALKFSSASDAVELILIDNTLIIQDRGSGIPKEVQERIGEPFNVGPHEEGRVGHGLGLAWVAAVAKLYRWGFEVQTSPSGTSIRIQFPKEEAES